MLKKLVKFSERYYQIVEENTVVGKFELWRMNGIVELWNFELDKEQRGKGYGDKALKDILSFVKQKYSCALQLHVLKDNQIAINLYNKNGFSVSHINSMSFTMIKHLNDQ